MYYIECQISRKDDYVIVIHHKTSQQIQATPLFHNPIVVQTTTPLFHNPQLLILCSLVSDIIT